MKKYTIKPLNWRLDRESVEGDTYSAGSIVNFQIIVMKVVFQQNKKPIVYGYIGGPLNHETDDLEEAKASCQAQHEHSIKYFLNEVPE